MIQESHNQAFGRALRFPWFEWKDWLMFAVWAVLFVGFLPISYHLNHWGNLTMRLLGTFVASFLTAGTGAAMLRLMLG